MAATFAYHGTRGSRAARYSAWTSRLIWRADPRNRSRMVMSVPFRHHLTPRPRQARIRRAVFLIGPFAVPGPPGQPQSPPVLAGAGAGAAALFLERRHQRPLHGLRRLPE